MCYRPLSLPDNLIDLSVSNEDVGSEVALESSADSVDSAGFFRRFADHMRAASAVPRPAVYCKGVTDYSFSQSPTVDNPASSVNRSILVQAGFDPPESGDECPTEAQKIDIDQQLFIGGSEISRPVQVSVSSSVSVSASPTISASKATAGRKRWSDFGTRLIGFVDKILLPEADKKPSQTGSGQQEPRKSESEEQLCTMSAAHAIGRRSAARGLGSQSDAGDVIQMYSDMGRLWKDAVQQEEENQSTVTATDSLQTTSVSTEELPDDSVLRYECYFVSPAAYGTKARPVPKDEKSLLQGYTVFSWPSKLLWI